MEQKTINNKGYNTKNDTRKCIKIFGKKYRLRESARQKYIFIGECLTALSIFISGYIFYCLIWALRIN